MSKDLGVKAQKYDRTVVFMGNPGVGKSTLLNLLIGCREKRDEIFACGESFGEGLTVVQTSFVHNGICWVDTPGLADPRRRQQAAEEITKALQVAGTFTLIFVIETRGGRVSPEDTSTMILVLNACRHVEGIDFGIIVNKVSKPVFSGFFADGNLDKFLDVINQPFIAAELPISNNVFIIPSSTALETHKYDMTMDLQGESLDLFQELTLFVDRCPRVIVKEKDVQAIEYSSFKQLRDETDIDILQFLDLQRNVIAHGKSIEAENVAISEQSTSLLSKLDLDTAEEPSVPDTTQEEQEAKNVETPRRKKKVDGKKRAKKLITTQEGDSSSVSFRSRNSAPTDLKQMHLVIKSIDESNIEQVQKEVAAKFDLLAAINDKQDTIFHYAIQKCKPDVLKKLFALLAESKLPWPTNSCLETVLLCCCKDAFIRPELLEMIPFLLEKGHPCTADLQSTHPLHILVGYEWNKQIRMCCGSIFNSDPNCINAVDSQNRTPLHVAVEKRSFEAVKWLLKKGAIETLSKSYNVGGKTHCGEYPHTIATRHNMYEILGYLFEKRNLVKKNSRDFLQKIHRVILLVQELFLSVSNRKATHLSTKQMSAYINELGEYFEQLLCQHDSLSWAATKEVNDLWHYCVDRARALVDMEPIAPQNHRNPQSMDTLLSIMKSNCDSINSLSTQFLSSGKTTGPTHAIVLSSFIKLFSQLTALYNNYCAAVDIISAAWATSPETPISAPSTTSTQFVPPTAYILKTLFGVQKNILGITIEDLVHLLPANFTLRECWEQIKKTYEMGLDSSIRKKVTSVMQLWCKHYGRYFDETLKEDIELFKTKYPKKLDCVYIVSSKVADSPVLQPIVLESNPVDPLEYFLGGRPQRMYSKIAKLEVNLYNAIHKGELVLYFHDIADPACVNLIALSRFQQKLASFVQLLIKYDNLRALSTFVDIAERFWENGYFNSFFGVTTGILYSSEAEEISIKKPLQKRIKALGELCFKNRKEINTQMANLDFYVPAVNYLLTTLQSHNTHATPETKLRHLHEIIKEFLKHQNNSHEYDEEDNMEILDSIVIELPEKVQLPVKKSITTTSTTTMITTTTTFSVPPPGDVPPKPDIPDLKRTNSKISPRPPAAPPVEPPRPAVPPPFSRVTPSGTPPLTSSHPTQTTSSPYKPPISQTPPTGFKIVLPPSSDAQAKPPRHPPPATPGRYPPVSQTEQTSQPPPVHSPRYGPPSYTPPLYGSLHGSNPKISPSHHHPHAYPMTEAQILDSPQVEQKPHHFSDSPQPEKLTQLINTPPPILRFCTNCGSATTPAFKYCGSCGKPLPP